MQIVFKGNVRTQICDLIHCIVQEVSYAIYHLPAFYTFLSNHEMGSDFLYM